MPKRNPSSKAADRLLLSQPALSRQLKRVEESLDAKLFTREQNEMRLTNAGKIYVNGARSIQNIYERALNHIRKLSQSGKHQITFIYNNILLPDFSTEILPDFRKLQPDIVLSTINGNASVAKDYLSNGMADLAVVATRAGDHSMLEFLPLREEELMLAFRKPIRLFLILNNMVLIYPCFPENALS
ncbi:MAG: LysR family transcriptional regulator [Lachnospiraceae bacterium]